MKKAPAAVNNRRYQRQAKSRTLKLSEWDQEKLFEISTEAWRIFNNVDNPNFLQEHHRFTAQLPLPLRQFLLGFKNSDCDFILIQGLKIDNKKRGSTPVHWSEEKSEYVKQLQFINFFIAASLGHTFGWQIQQLGSLVSDVLPIKGYETKQQGFGSESGLRFHTEDPFHIGRADYFTLMSMRNHEQIPTTVFPMNLHLVPESVKNELFKAQFPIIPDESHTELTYENELNAQQWSVLNWNTRAKKFYEEMGAVAMDEWTTFRLDAKKCCLQEGTGL